jgi:hypothetical protein
MVRKALIRIQHMELKGTWSLKGVERSLSRVSDRSFTLSAKPFSTLRLPLR